MSVVSQATTKLTHLVFISWYPTVTHCVGSIKTAKSPIIERFEMKNKYTTASFFFFVEDVRLVELHTLYLLPSQVRVIAGDSGLCCYVFKTQITILVSYKNSINCNLLKR